MPWNNLVVGGITRRFVYARPDQWTGAVVAGRSTQSPEHVANEDLEHKPDKRGNHGFDGR